jgi:anti-sigma factor RsiW
MMLLVRRRDELVCQQVVELVTDYLEDALSRRDRKRFERHLRACPNCTAYLDQMRTTIAATGRLTPDDLTPQARAEFTRLFRAWSADDGDDPDAPDDPVDSGDGPH